MTALAVLLTLAFIGRTIQMAALDDKIQALQNAAAKVTQDFAAAKSALAQAQADLAAAKSSATTQAQLDAVQAVTDQLNAADPAPATPGQ